MELEVKRFNEQYLDEAIALIEKSDHTNRLKESWIKNNMSATLAFKANQLVAIIPFEQFPIAFPKDKFAHGCWVSAAHVDEELRGSGIGTKLDQAIEKLFPELDLILVVRKDEGTAAFKWYQKIGYDVISKIVSLKFDSLSFIKAKSYEHYNDLKTFKSLGPELQRCFNLHHKDYIGFPKREINFWENKFAHHYYANSYKYHLLICRNEQNEIESYAFLGRTEMGDKVDRLDILEWSASAHKQDQIDLFNMIQNYAFEQKTNEIRVQYLEMDPMINQALDYGFVKRWETNLMGKMFRSNEKLPKNQWRFFHVDYI